MILTPPITPAPDAETYLNVIRQDLLRMDTGIGEPFDVLSAKMVKYNIQTLDDDATPSVKGYTVWLTGGTTTITDFDDGVEGQIIIVIAEHSLTITDGTNIFLSGSANWDMTATDTLTLICKADGKWYEIGRSDSGA
ncbi:MAG TPA: hypothetical protein HPP87_07155 [Planctomycetes bacterium]|nr:hypothetical protein [Planctomycetota bacterium]